MTKKVGNIGRASVQYTLTDSTCGSVTMALGSLVESPANCTSTFNPNAITGLIEDPMVETNLLYTLDSPPETLPAKFCLVKTTLTITHSISGGT